MRRVLLICLSLVMALVGWSTVCADDGFYVIAGQKANYAPIPKTGQTTSYGPGDDGALQKGVAWPTQRFTNNGNGTVTDHLTGLIWLRNANAFGQCLWSQALSAANGLAAPAAGLSDGSKAGDWRLPNLHELQSLIYYSSWISPAMPSGNFTDVPAGGQARYWSSTSAYGDPTVEAWYVDLYDGSINYEVKGVTHYVLCVRGGK
jgi:hypothetical protein